MVPVFMDLLSVGEIKSLFNRNVIRKAQGSRKHGKEGEKREVRIRDDFPGKWCLRGDLKYKQRLAMQRTGEKVFQREKERESAECAKV